MSWRPIIDAPIKAVEPLLSFTFTSAPLSNSNLTMSWWPNSDADIRSVEPWLLSCIFTSVPSDETVSIPGRLPSRLADVILLLASLPSCFVSLPRVPDTKVNKAIASNTAVLKLFNVHILQPPVFVDYLISPLAYVNNFAYCGHLRWISLCGTWLSATKIPLISRSIYCRVCGFILRMCIFWSRLACWHYHTTQKFRIFMT